MPDDQRRSAERVELKKPIEAKLVDFSATITEISLINCRLEHIEKVPMHSNVLLQFRWLGDDIRLKGKLTRSEMRPIGGKLTYISAMEFADSIENAPAPLRRLIASLLGQEEDKVQEQKVQEQKAEPQKQPPKEAPKQAAKEAPKEAAKAPPKKAAAAPWSPAPPLRKSSAPPPAPPVRNLSIAEEVDDDEVEEIESSAELPAIRFVECSLDAGKWTVREVIDPRQPREGFTMIAPDDPKEVDEFCKTYGVADPETRRMIRLSFELAISKVNG